MYFHPPSFSKMNPNYLAQLLKPQLAGADSDGWFTHELMLVWPHSQLCPILYLTSALLMLLMLLNTCLGPFMVFSEFISGEKRHINIYKAVNVKLGQQTNVCSIGEVVLLVLTHCRPEFSSIKMPLRSCSYMSILLQFSWPSCNIPESFSETDFSFSRCLVWESTGGR